MREVSCSIPKHILISPRKKNCILQMPRNTSHLQVLQMITAHHDFQISWLNFSLLLDLAFMQACGNVLQTDKLAQLRCMKIAYGMSIEPVQALDPDFPSIVAATMKELPRLESITLDHKWWSWHWRPTKLIDLLSDHDWPNLRSCVLKAHFCYLLADQELSAMSRLQVGLSTYRRLPSE